MGDFSFPSYGAAREFWGSDFQDDDYFGGLGSRYHRDYHDDGLNFYGDDDNDYVAASRIPARPVVHNTGSYDHYAPDEFPYEQFAQGTMLRQFKKLMSRNILIPLTAESIDACLQENEGLTSRLCRENPRLMLHGVLAMQCSLCTIQLVHGEHRKSIQLTDVDGLLPLHAALAYDRKHTIGFDVLKYVIQEYPTALTEPIKFGRNMARLPLHVMLLRAGWCSFLAEENLDAFLPRGYEHTLVGDLGDTSQIRCFPVHFHQLTKPKGYGRLALYHTLRQGRVLLSDQGLKWFQKPWIDWFLQHFFGPSAVSLHPFDAQARKYACDILMLRMYNDGPSEEKTVLHHIVGKMRALPPDITTNSRFLACFHRLKRAPYFLAKVVDAADETPLHFVNNRSQELLSLVINAFPDSLRHRNKQGLTPWASNCLYAHQRFDGPKFVNTLYVLLREHPEAILDCNLRALRDPKKRRRLKKRKKRRGQKRLQKLTRPCAAQRKASRSRLLDLSSDSEEDSS